MRDDYRQDQGRYGYQDLGPSRMLDRDRDGRLDRDDVRPGAARGRPDERGMDDRRYPEDRHFDRGRDEWRGDETRSFSGGRFEFGSPDRRFSLEDTRRRLPREETDRLIASDKVEGTAVYDMHGRRIGEVVNFMVEKRSGRVEYAVVRVRGGFVAGETYRPIEWRDLHYDIRLDGYQIDLARDEIRRDRSFAEGR